MVVFPSWLPFSLTQSSRKDKTQPQKPSNTSVDFPQRVYYRFTAFLSKARFSLTKGLSMKNSRMLMALAFSLVLFACAGENGTNGVDGVNGVDGTNASIQTTALTVGDENCPSGGVRIDVLSNGIVQTDQTQYVCNGAKGDTGETGAPGAQGPSGETGDIGTNNTNSSIQITTVIVGDEMCPAGGVKIEVLLNGNVQTEQTQYVCNGAKGDTGEAGIPGPQGPQGPKGEQGDASETGGNVSGSRLKARYASTPDGAKVFMGWYDSQLNEKCTFRLAEDGRMRCLPVADFEQNMNFSYGEAFLDSQCLGQSFLLVHEVSCDKGTSRYAFFYNSNRSLCEQGQPVSVFELHSHEECDETGYFYKLSESGECVKYYSCASFTPYTYTKLDPEIFVSVSTDETYE